MRSVTTLTSAVLLLLGLGCAQALGIPHPQPLILAAIVCLVAFALQEPDALPVPQSLRA